MKGILFNLFEGFITDNYGEEKLEEIMSKTKLHTKEPFVGPGTYRDEDLIALVNTAAELLGISVPEALRLYGKYSFPNLANKFPIFVEKFKHPKDFLKALDSIIHVEVRKLFRHANTPKFECEDPAPNELKMKYKSKRKLCHLVEGLLEGLAEFYKVPLSYTQTVCALNDGDVCEFNIKFKT